MLVFLYISYEQIENKVNKEFHLLWYKKIQILRNNLTKGNNHSAWKEKKDLWEEEDSLSLIFQHSPNRPTDAVQPLPKASLFKIRNGQVDPKKLKGVYFPT